MYIFWCILPLIWARISKEKQCEHKKWREKASLNTPNIWVKFQNSYFSWTYSPTLRQNYFISESSELEIKNKYGVMNM